MCARCTSAPLVICAVGTYVGHLIIHNVIDNDHWRHLFLIYGIIWGAMGAARDCFESARDYALSREQFGRPLAEFDLVREKIGWLASYTYGVEAMTYLTTGMVDAGVEHIDLDVSAEVLMDALAHEIQLPYCVAGIGEGRATVVRAGRWSPNIRA